MELWQPILRGICVCVYVCVRVRARLGLLEIFLPVSIFFGLN